jgi:hypothetical protein
MEPAVGRLFYGSYWRIPLTGPENWDATVLLYNALAKETDEELDADSSLADLVDQFTNLGAQVSLCDNIFTVYFGVVVTDLSTEENTFDEMALLRLMDLDKGTLEEDVKEHVKNLLQAIPYDLREKFSRPGFHIAWGTT